MQMGKGDREAVDGGIMVNISAKLAQLQQELGNVTLIAVTKYATDTQIQEILESGYFILGESRVQVAQEKTEKFSKYPIQWHLIGHLQTNKAKQAVKIFEMIQSVDSERLAKELDKEASKIQKIQKVLIQINIGREPQKSGVEPEKTAELYQQLKTLKHLKVCGLMAMAPYDDDPEKSRPYFKEMKKLFDSLYTPQDILSMGMSGDYKVAIEEGSNMVRIGSDLFN